MSSRKHYQKELGRKLIKHGRYDFLAWMDHRLIHFISYYHDPREHTILTSYIRDANAGVCYKQLAASQGHQHDQRWGRVQDCPGPLSKAASVEAALGASLVGTGRSVSASFRIMTV